MRVQDDFILREIHRFVAAILQALFGIDSLSDEDLEHDSEALTGLKLDRAEELAVPDIIEILSEDEQLHAGHALAVGLGLAHRAAAYHRVGAEGAAQLVSHKAADLMRIAIEERPDLASPDLQRIIDRLRGSPES